MKCQLGSPARTLDFPGKLTGCVFPTSFNRWISITSWRSLRFPPDRVLSSVRVRSVAFWRSLARGCADSSSSSASVSIPSSASESSESVFRRFAASSGSTHSGVGCNRRNCLRNRRVYSLPLITSSDSVVRSLRNLALPARETANRSSSLSCQIAGAESSPSSVSDGVSDNGAVSVDSGAIPESRKKS